MPCATSTSETNGEGAREGEEGGTAAVLDVGAPPVGSVEGGFSAPIF